MPGILLNRLKEFDITSDLSLEEFLKKARDALFSLYGQKRDKAKSFADSRFTPIDQMVERGMVSCGSLTNIFGAILRGIGVPVKFIHGDSITKVKDAEKTSRHSWLEIYDPLHNSWIEADPTHPTFGMWPEAKRIREYHDWLELKRDYDDGNF